MYSVIKKNKGLENKPFPKLMQSIQNSTVVFFHKPKYGFVVYVNEDSVEDYTDSPGDWDMDLFVDFNGTVELSNDLKPIKPSLLFYPKRS